VKKTTLVVATRQVQSSTANDELISRAHRPERYCVTHAVSEWIHPLSCSPQSRRTNGPVGGATIDHHGPC